MYCGQCVQGFGDLEDQLFEQDFAAAYGPGSDLAGGNFFDSLFGKALLDIGTAAAKVGTTVLIQRALGPGGGTTQSGQQLYAAYNSPVVRQPAAPAAAPKAGTVTAASLAGQGQPTATNFTPWLVAGAGALLLVAILK